MKAETFRRLREVASAPVFWTEDDVETALNAGYAELSDETEWFEQYLEIDLLTNRPYYDLFTIIGDSFLAIRPGFDEQTSRWLTPSSVKGLDARDTRWERVTGEPQRVVVRGLRWLGLYPRVQTEVGTFKQYYTALPDPLVEDDDEPGFPETFHLGCVEFALTDLWAQDAETPHALEAWGRYLVLEAGLTAWVDGRASGPMAHGFSGSPS